MKNQLKIYFKIGILFFGISLLLWNCEKENLFEVHQSGVNKHLFKVKTITLSEIPQIRDFILDKTNDNIFTKSTEIDGAIFDDDNILEVIDTLNHTNYSFRFSYPDTPIGTFYNLIVGKTSQGENKTPYVLKYVCDPEHLDTFVTSNFNFESFKGTIAIHKYTDFFQVGSILKTEPNCPPNNDENGDPIPCDTGEVDGGSSGSSGGGGDGDPAGTNNTTTYNTSSGSTETYSNSGSSESGSGSSSGSGDSGGGSGASPCTTSNTCVQWGEGGQCTWNVVIINPDCLNNDDNFTTENDESVTKNGSDCPDCPDGSDGGVGVLTNPNTTDEIIVDPLFEEEFPCQSEIVKNSFLETAPLSQLILNIFDDDNSGYNLVFDVDYSLGDGIAGGTYPISVNSEWDLEKLDIKVGLSEALLNNGTDLAIATTVIHESIHALLIYMVETGKLTVDNTVNDDFDLGALVRAYLAMKIELEQFGGNPNAGDTDLWMHDYMTGFVDDIATSVSAFGNSKGYNIPFNYYKKLAWLGLKDSLELLLADDSDGFTQNDQDEVDVINTVIVDEFLNRLNAKGEKCTNN